MIKSLIISVFLFFIHSYSAQFAEIVDKDGFVNVRREPNTKSVIAGQINSGEIVYIFNGDEFDEWQIVDYAIGSDSLLTGYVHQSRLKMVSAYEKIPTVFAHENAAEFTSKNIEIKIKTENFDYDKNKHHIKTFQYPNNAVSKYKGQEIWGTDGTIPRTHYQSISIKMNGKLIEIPEKEIENLFNPNTESTECYYDEKNKRILITSMNSDGAGSYEVLFIIQNGKYLARKVYLAN